ncbi:unnamed protein product [Onchocerca flexuosa]|uniref:TFIIS-type domain-containing protein n=1 Tax=Onchocerca flexuosa TaxID=387005 RepID=A0A183H3W3_9BILA|nr:unnamed protein product [Onchocerca flexuosa]
MMTATATIAETAAPTTKLTVMKCRDCNAPFTKNDEFGNCTDGDESLTQNISGKKSSEKRDCWWWCRDCMATLCR